MHLIVFLPLFITIFIVISNCTATKGSIVILENSDGTGFTADYKEWSSKASVSYPLTRMMCCRLKLFMKPAKLLLRSVVKTAVNPIRVTTLSQVYLP